MKTSLKSICSLVALFAAASLSAESLWLKAGNNALGQFADKRATAVGDIITVVISESTSQNASLKTKGEKSAGINNVFTQFLFPNTLTENGETPTVDISGDNDYEGKGEVANSTSVSARMSVIVTDVLPNGNLVLEGVRSVTFAKESQYMVLRGLARPHDVTADNTILSNQIANATLEFVGEGEVSSAAHKGWLMKLNDFVNPF